MTKPVLSTFGEIAPLLIQQYERYLPSAFDDSLTMLQKVNMIIKRLDELGVLSNELVKQWNTVIEWVMGEGLDESVQTRLDEMIVDGTLDTLINETIFEDLNRKIEDVAVNVKNYGVKGDGVTDDSQKIIDVVKLAYDNGYTLHWAHGTYITNLNIPYFHDVKHTGNGTLKRGTNLYKINMAYNDTNILYTGYGSNPANDGLSELQPRSIVQVRDALQRLGDKASRGRWRVQFVAGMTQETGIVFNNMPFFSQPLQIWGKFDGVTHLSVWDGTTSSAMYAIRADGNNGALNIEFKDIKFQNWKGDPTNAGAIVCWQDVNVRTDNVFVLDSTIAIWCRGGYSRHYGDRLENCVWGYGFQYSHTASVGSSIYNRNKIINCDKGVFVGRSTVAHIDYTDFTNCTVSMQVHQKSRIASVQSTFATWEDVCIWLQGDSIFEDDGSTWDGNSITDATPIYRFDNGSSVPAVHTGVLPYRVAHYIPSIGYTITGTTLDDLMSNAVGFGSPLRIPKHLLYNNGTLQIIVKMRVDVSGNGGTKTIKLAGANSTTQVIASIDIPSSVTGGALGEVTFELTLRANGSGIYKATYECSNPELNVRKFSSISSTVFNAVRDKTADLTLWRLYGSVNGVGDTMSLFSLTTHLLG
jgi:hypothetical protein